MAVHTVVQVGDCEAQFDGTLSKGTVATVVVTMPAPNVYRVICGADQWTVPGTHSRANNTPPAMTVQPVSS